MIAEATRPLRLAAVIVRTYGTRGILRRTRHEVRRIAGAFRLEPKYANVRPRSRSAVVYSPVGNWRSVPDSVKEAVLRRAGMVLSGRYEAFGSEWRSLPQPGKGWHTHPTGYVFPDRPWWEISLLPPEADVKDVWEPARFAWVYDLIRAYSLSNDRRFVEFFYQQLASWVESNPPFRGVQWACGQETAIRAIALLHAEDCFREVTEDAALHKLLISVIGWSGERIADAIGYGLSQRNNHGISEAAGLIHIGLRLRGGHPDAEAWVRSGKVFLERQIQDQFGKDGWYSQHSFTYCRFAIEQVLLAQKALNACGESLSQKSLVRVTRSVELLTQLVDASSGVVPNHGANDGGRLAPISTAAYRNFLPLLTLASLLLEYRLPADLRADIEVLNWMGREEPPRAPALQDGVVSGESGWAAARVGGYSVFIRAGNYTHRPSHMDALHLDVRGPHGELITDAGTFAYNGPHPWKNALAVAAVHNGPVMGDSATAVRGPRFLWYTWPSARLRPAEFREGVARIGGETAEGVRREVTVAADRVEVTDYLPVGRVGGARTLWLIHPGVTDLHFKPSAIARMFEAREGAVEGWFSPTYGLRIPSKFLQVGVSSADLHNLVKTVVTAPAELRNPGEQHSERGATVEIALAPPS